MLFVCKRTRDIINVQQKIRRSKLPRILCSICKSVSKCKQIQDTVVAQKKYKGLEGEDNM